MGAMDAQDFALARAAGVLDALQVVIVAALLSLVACWCGKCGARSSARRPSTATGELAKPAESKIDNINAPSR